MDAKRGPGADGPRLSLHPAASHQDDDDEVPFSNLIAV
jgi:hypothetical protein